MEPITVARLLDAIEHSEPPLCVLLCAAFAFGREHADTDVEPGMQEVLAGIGSLLIGVVARNQNGGPSAFHEQSMTALDEVAHRIHTERTRYGAIRRSLRTDD